MDARDTSGAPEEAGSQGTGDAATVRPRAWRSGLALSEAEEEKEWMVGGP